LDKVILKLCGAFLIKDISDFCILIIYHEALSYESKIFFKAFVSVSYVEEKKVIMSKKKMIDRWSPTRHFGTV
jgi:hypothetical protein